MAKAGLSTDIIKSLNAEVAAVTLNKELVGFEKSFQIASAIQKLKEMLTDEYMAPIMAMQGNRLGFKTDRDLNKDKTKGRGYEMAVVKDCLIEAVLLGVQPYGNQFNIISGSCYLTKEGLKYILDGWPGLTYKIVPSLPKIQKPSAAVDMTITWTINGNTQKEIIPIALKVDDYTGIDAIVGKATRKARAWLYSSISGMEMPEGDVEDIKTPPPLMYQDPAIDKEAQRVELLIRDADTITKLENLQPFLTSEYLQEKWNERHFELIRN